MSDDHRSRLRILTTFARQWAQAEARQKGRAAFDLVASVILGVAVRMAREGTLSLEAFKDEVDRLWSKEID